MACVGRAFSILHGWGEFLCVVNGDGGAHIPVIEQRSNQHRKVSKEMSARKSARGFFGTAIAIFGAASAAAAAVEGNRRPLDRDLHTLGINPANFHSTKR
ncbi:MAG TPA: hypothetical protein VL202_18775 [Pararhizobium sp.]|uniref:hypothetical protein n=1 Tax=Pararhizobium sp. TaxID=1977563 RepID=UPI002C299FCA|nr:hypothetical protein [Pararhizobium sp.]HTO33196.1 hypothetical protein [Pararhizobium sp.]